MIKHKMLRRKLTAIIINIALLVGLLSGCSTKENEASGTDKQTESEVETDDIKTKYQDALDKFTEKLVTKMEQDGIPGASLSVMEDGEMIYSNGFGYADQEQKTQVDQNTLFSSGSIGKLYATAAMLKLVQNHGFSLDDPVIDHLPEFEMEDVRYKGITLRMLLNHSAGLPGDAYAATADWAGEIPQDDFGQAHLEELKTQTLKSNPGEYAAYSNTGFEIAQNVIEKVSGQTYETYLKKNFFEPMELNNTYLASNEEVEDENFALPMDSEGRNLPREYTSSSIAAAGGLTASTQDTCKFADQILSPDSGILDEESIIEFRADQSLSSKLPEQQELNALGWDEISHKITQTPVYSKAGGTTNYAAQVLSAPDAGITIAAATSQSNTFISEELESLMHDILCEKGLIKDNSDMPSFPKEANTDEAVLTYPGIYFGQDDLGAVIGSGVAGLQMIGIEDNIMQHSIWDGTDWQSVGQYSPRDDDSYGYYDEENMVYTSYSFKHVDGSVFLMKRVITPYYDKTTAVAKQLLERTDNKSWEKYDNSLWLRTNIWPSDYQAGACLSYMQIIEKLKGYVVMNGGFPILEIGDETHATGVNEMIGSYYGDLTFTDDGFSWMGMEYIDAGEAEQLPNEDTTISIENANIVQWYYVPEDVQIDIDVPYDEVRILTLDTELIPFYDNLTGSKLFTATAGSYIGLTSAAPVQIDVGISSLESF